MHTWHNAATFSVSIDLYEDGKTECYLPEGSEQLLFRTRRELRWCELWLVLRDPTEAALDAVQHIAGNEQQGVPLR